MYMQMREEMHRRSTEATKKQVAEETKNAIFAAGLNLYPITLNKPYHSHSLSLSVNWDNS